MFRSLRFRIPALFLLGIVLAGVVATLIAVTFFQSYTRSHAVDELRAESIGIVELYARQTGVADVPVEVRGRFSSNDKLSDEDRKAILKVVGKAIAPFQPAPDPKAKGTP